MRIYLDVCCLNRPFDDQRQPRIRMESEAITLVLGQVDAGDWRQVSSQVAEMEIQAIADVERRRRVEALLPSRRDRVRLSAAMFDRARTLLRHGLQPADALHVAAAEASRADVFLTCDDRLLRRGRRMGALVKLRIANPVRWVQEMWSAPNA
jgi:predicted nucleic acid-binding protein